MGQAEMDGHALLGSPRGGGAGQRKIGRTAFPAQHGQIAEGKAAQPGTRGLQEGFFGRKIGGGALGAVMTGTGSAVFGVFDDRAAAAAAYERLSQSYRECFLVRAADALTL